jgi:hypothetical protein
MDNHIACLKEGEWGKLWEIIKNLSAHVIEGEREGGFRDRLLKAEIDIKAMKERFWQSALIGGIIGALVGSGSKDILVIFFNWFMKR